MVKMQGGTGAVPQSHTVQQRRACITCIFHSAQRENDARVLLEEEDGGLIGHPNPCWKGELMR